MVNVLIISNTMNIFLGGVLQLFCCDIFSSLLSKNESRLTKSPVCLSVCVCVPTTSNFCLVDFHEIWNGGNAIQGDLEAIIFNPIALIILKLLRFKVVRWALLNCRFGSCFMVTMETKLFTVNNNGNQVGLDCLCTTETKLFTPGNHGNYGNQVV
jgi:hypothetical protein